MKSLFLFLILCSCYVTNAQYTTNDSLSSKGITFKPAALILPAALITYGAIGVKNDPFDRWDANIRASLKPNGQRTQIDDGLVVAPLIGAYALNAFGIEGKHRFWDRTILSGMSAAFMIASVRIVKHNYDVPRPTGDSRSSFPSGHTSFAFMSAEILHQEFGHKSIWYSISGYTIAATTGFLRLVNDKHWFTDVVAGAGVGILSTKLVYWIYNWITPDTSTDTLISESNIHWQFASSLAEDEFTAGIIMSF